MPRRSRSRSRDRDRDRDRRRRSRSRSREHRSSHRSRDRSPGSRSRRSAFSEGEQSQQYAHLAQMQQQQLQKQLLAQQMLLQQQALSGNLGMVAGRKQREVYVGNLTIGVVTDVMLKELFNGALAHLVPDPAGNPPVVNAQLDPSGRFGFVEMRTEELATSGMQLDKVELCGRHINVGRPKGYVQPPPGAPSANLGAAQIFAATITNAATRVLLLQNMLKAHQMWDEDERRDLLEDVQEESGKYGRLQGIAVPRPPPGTPQDVPNRVFLVFEAPEEARKAKDVFDGRSFDGNTITAKFVAEEDFERAQRGEWPPMDLPGQAGSAMPPPPGPSQVAGAAALNPVMAHVPPAALPGVLPGPWEAVDEGWLKLRGIPFNVAKPDIITFFQGCGTFTEDSVKLVLGGDGRPSGEAYVEVAGPGAKLRQALSRDRQIMPNSSRYVEVFASNREEVERRALTGVVLV